MRKPFFATLFLLLIASVAFPFADKGQPKQEAKQQALLSGKVTETLNSGGYTYILLDQGKSKTWVAVPQMPVKVGQKVSLLPGMEMGRYTSKTLNKTFDQIIFSAGPATGQSSQEDAVKKAHSAAKAEAPAAPIKVEKAKGADAYTVAEVFEKKGNLNQKKVSVRGKAVKVSTGIMGKNWIHLQDGSGSSDKGTNDLVVTTNETAAQGDVLTVSGTLVKDKDFGSGYKYAVIIENAKLSK